MTNFGALVVCILFIAVIVGVVMYHWLRSIQDEMDMTEARIRILRERLGEREEDLATVIRRYNKMYDMVSNANIALSRDEDIDAARGWLGQILAEDFDSDEEE